VVNWLFDSVTANGSQLVQAQWFFASMTQSFAALMALTGIFGVYRLQILHASSTADFQLVAAKLRRLADALSLGPSDLGGIELDRPHHPADILRAYESARTRIEKLSSSTEIAGFAELMAYLSFQTPYNEFRDAVERYNYLVRESARVRSWVISSMCVTAVVTATAIVLLLVAPGLAGSPSPWCLSIAMTSSAVLCVLALAFVVLSSVVILLAGQGAVAERPLSVPKRMEVQVSEPLKTSLAGLMAAREKADTHEGTGEQTPPKRGQGTETR
jgi:hypothetical protein